VRVDREMLFCAVQGKLLHFLLLLCALESSLSRFLCHNFTLCSFELKTDLKSAFGLSCERRMCFWVVLANQMLNIASGPRSHFFMVEREGGGANAVLVRGYFLN
jgi:hypothetical protein